MALLNVTRLRMTQAQLYGTPSSVAGVTSVDVSGGTTGLSFTGGPITSSGTITASGTIAVGSGGTGITSGTSGGVLYFSAAGVIGSSAALSANQIVLGGGAGAAPATLGSLGTTTTVLHGNAAGAPTFGAVSLTADVSGVLPLGNGGTNGLLDVGHGGTGATTLTGLLRGNGAAAITGAAQASLTTEVTGILPYANGGTNASTAWTQGSVFFAGASAFAQDNANFFWDATNHRLGIGTTSPTSPVTVNGTLELKAGSGGVIKFADGTTQASAAGGGGTVNGTGTATNVAFWSAGTTISSDNALFWDNTNKRLGVGTNAPGSGYSVVTPSPQLEVQNATAASGTSIVLSGTRSADGICGDFTVGNTTVASTDNRIGVLRFSRSGANNQGKFDLFVRGGAGFVNAMTVLPTGLVGITNAAPATALDVVGTISAKDTLQFNGSTSGYLALKANATSSSVTLTLPAGDSTGTQYLRSNGAGVLSWGTPAGAGTVTTNGSISSGMIMFNDPSGSTVITGVNNLFWNNANSRLGILTSSPIAPLHIGAQTNVPALTPQVLVDVAGSAYYVAKDTLDATEATFGADSNGGYVGTNTSSALNLVTNGVARANIQPTGAFRLIGATSGYVGLQAAAVAGSTTYTLPSADGTSGQVLKTNGSGTLSWTTVGGTSGIRGVYDVTDYGAVADGKYITDGAMTTGSTTLTSASNPFVVGDVGKSISVSGAAAAGGMLYTTIAGYVSAGQVTLTAPNASGGNISGKTVSWGTDNTTAFTNAFTAANTPAGIGGTVYVPPAQYAYRISTHLSVPATVTLLGAHANGFLVQSFGSVLHAVEGAGSSSGTPFISATFNTTVCGFSILYPHQVTVGTPIAFPFCIKGAAYCNLRNLFLMNPYQGIDLASEVTTPYNGAFNVFGIYGMPMLLGIDVDQSYDTSTISDIHFWPFWSQDSSLATWRHNNSIGLRFGRSDWQIVNNVFTYGSGIGFQFNESGRIAGGTSAQLSNIGIDACQVGIDATSTGYQGVNIHGLTVSGALAFDGYGIRANYDATKYALITVSQGQFFGTLLYGIYQDSVNGWISASQCRFVQVSTAHVGVNRGAASINQSQFFPSFSSSALNVAAGVTQPVTFTANQLNACTTTILNATTLSANNQ